MGNMKINKIRLFIPIYSVNLSGNLSDETSLTVMHPIEILEAALR